MKAIYFENVSATKLKELRTALTCLKDIHELFTNFSGKVQGLRSKRLRSLLTSDAVGGIFPSQLSESIEVLDKMLVWRTNGAGEEIPEP